MDTVTVLQTQADWLAIRLQVAGFDLIFVSYHGPHSMQSDDCIQAWWRQAKWRLRELERVAPILFLGDPNAQVSKCVGISWLPCW